MHCARWWTEMLCALFRKLNVNFCWLRTVHLQAPVVQMGKRFIQWISCHPESKILSMLNVCQGFHAHLRLMCPECAYSRLSEQMIISLRRLVWWLIHQIKLSAGQENVRNGFCWAHVQAMSITWASRASWWINTEINQK